MKKALSLIFVMVFAFSLVSCGKEEIKIRCLYCDATNPEDALYCNQCGKLLVASAVIPGNSGSVGNVIELDAEKQALVTVPTEAYVIQCLQTIPEITEIAAVTEDNDPNGNLNKAGGYTSTVYFSHESIDQDDVYGEDLIDKGTDAGGAIEVYTCIEDAIKREAYLAALDGTIMSSGSHAVIGTVVIRTSEELTATQQKELEEKIVKALTKS